MRCYCQALLHNTTHRLDVNRTNKQTDRTISSASECVVIARPTAFPSTYQIPVFKSMVSSFMRICLDGLCTLSCFATAKRKPRPGSISDYDFNFLHFKNYGKNEPRLMPGDSLVTTCIYNTKGMKETTKFGLETADEMCFNVIGIYPAIQLQFC